MRSLVEFIGALFGAEARPVKDKDGIVFRLLGRQGCVKIVGSKS